MAIQSFQLDPNAAGMTDNEVVTAINNASTAITRASAVSAAARPITAGEIGNTELASGAAKANLDAMAATTRGYVQTAPSTGQFPVVAVQRSASGELEVDYDDVAV